MFLTCLARRAWDTSHSLRPRASLSTRFVIGVIESGHLRRYAADAGITPEAYYERMVASSGIPLGRVGRAEEFGDRFVLAVSARFLRHGRGDQSRWRALPGDIGSG